MRTAEYVVLTDWPPGPEEQKSIHPEILWINFPFRLRQLQVRQPPWLPRYGPGPEPRFEEPAAPGETPLSNFSRL